ncbi:hypothetical protein CCAN12_370010 [Capnocytophaga canimorsus]|uniref:Uncharacterized protein n=1 Tax=Capnocytophaga canimorsus TaxID=28188 RepID=A0A0B7H3Y1_9FLAO|nr:hypothetical protein CCAN12_370010 [Capnocytophaga canimorsus]
MLLSKFFISCYCYGLTIKSMMIILRLGFDFAQPDRKTV